MDHTPDELNAALLLNRTELGRQVKSREFCKGARKGSLSECSIQRRPPPMRPRVPCATVGKGIFLRKVNISSLKRMTALAVGFRNTALRAWRECVGAGRVELVLHHVVLRRGLPAR